MWVIEWVRWKTSIIIITSSASLSSSFLSASELLTCHGTAMMIWWTVQWPQYSTSGRSLANLWVFLSQSVFFNHHHVDIKINKNYRYNWNTSIFHPSVSHKQLLYYNFSATQYVSNRVQLKNVARVQKKRIHSCYVP